MMSGYEVQKLSAEQLTDLWKARAGLLIIDWSGDTLRVSDGGDGSLYMQMGSFDVCTNTEGVRAMRDYLTEVLTHADSNEGS